MNRPGDRDEAADAIRGLIKPTRGAKHGEVRVTLHGKFGVILEWLGTRERKDA